MCRLRGFLISADLGPAEPPRILITAADANEGNFPQGRKKIHAEQIKSDDSSPIVAFLNCTGPGRNMIHHLAGNESII